MLHTHPLLFSMYFFFPWVGHWGSRRIGPVSFAFASQSLASHATERFSPNLTLVYLPLLLLLLLLLPYRILWTLFELVELLIFQMIQLDLVIYFK